MKDEYIQLILLLILLVIWAVMAFLLGYKEGQKDVINGKQKYFLIEFPNGERTWARYPKKGDFTGEYNNFKIIK